MNHIKIKNNIKNIINKISIFLMYHNINCLKEVNKIIVKIKINCLKEVNKIIIKIKINHKNINNLKNNRIY